MILRESRSNYRAPIVEQKALAISKYLSETKSKFAHIEVLGGQSFALFDKKYFKDEKAIEKFVDVVEGKKLSKECDGVATKSATVTDDELAKINSFALKALKKEDVAVFTMKVANNKIDRDMEKFSDEVLDSFAKTLVGKGWLYMHNKKDFMPFGKIFDSWTAVEAGAKWVYVKAYVLSTNEGLITNIDAGIWKFVSIGFIAPGFKVVQDNAGNFLYYEYTNVQGREAEGLEVSLVWLGAQYGAETAKSADKAFDVLKEARRILSAEAFEKCNTVDDVIKAVDEVKSKNLQNRNHPQINKGKTMKVSVKMFGADKLLTIPDNSSEEQIAEIVAAEYEKEFIAKHNPVVEENKVLKADKEKNKAAIEAFKDGLVNDVATAINAVLKFADDKKRESEVSRLKALDIPALQSELEIWKSRSEEKSPDGKSKTEAGNPAEEKAEVASAAAFQS